MATLLWRVLSSMGYPEGREPRYYWSQEKLGDGTLVGIEAMIPTSGGDPAWGGWVNESRGSTLWTKASRQSTLGYTHGSSLSADRCASYELDGDARHRQGFYPGSAAMWA